MGAGTWVCDANRPGSCKADRTVATSSWSHQCIRIGQISQWFTREFPCYALLPIFISTLDRNILLCEEHHER